MFSLKSLLHHAHADATGSQILRPRDIAALYQLHPLYAKGWKGQGVHIGFVEFCRPNQPDDQMFWAGESLDPALNTPVNVVDVDASASDPHALSETDLDIQYVGALAPGAKLTAYLISDRGSVEAFMGQMYDAVNQAISDGVQILSISLGTGDRLVAGAGAISAAHKSWSGQTPYLNDFDALITSNRLMAFVAAGDSGAYGGLPFGDNRPQPIWPAIQSSVISVGGTQLAIPGDLTSREEAWGGQTLDPAGPYFNRSNTLPHASGGGGVSSLAPAPFYQSHLGYSGRATPDISAFSGPLQIIFQGNAMSIWGTSAAAPIAAAVAALILQGTGHILTHHDLYAHARPVTSGNNWNNQLAQMHLDTVFTSQSGYSLCTGQGTLAAGAFLQR